MSSQYYDFSGFNIDRALIDFNGDIIAASSYAYNAGEKEDFLKAYREKVKQWMKYNHKNMKWLASQIGMSEGSTKNLLYTNLNITPEKLAAIQKAMDEGLEIQENQAIGFLDLTFYEDSKLLEDLADFSAWSLAAEIPISCFTQRNLEEHPYDASFPYYYANAEDILKLAEWTTLTLTNEAATILRTFHARNGDNIQLPSYQKQKSVSARLSNIYSYAPSCDILEHNYCSERGEYQRLKLPIIKEQWKPIYIELAISMNNQSVAEWVISTLNKEAHKQGLANLADFISSTLD